MHDRLQCLPLAQQPADAGVQPDADKAERAEFQQGQELAQPRAVQQRLTAPHRRAGQHGGSEVFEQLAGAQTAARVAEEADERNDTADGQRHGGRPRDQAAALTAPEHEVERNVQRQHHGIDEQRRQRLVHGVVCLVDQVQHAEARHAQCVHGEHAAGHLRGDGVEVAALEQDVDDRHGKGGKQRRERQDNKQRVFYRAADVALVFLRIYLRIGQIVFREQHNADAVDKRRCDRREELVRIVHGAHGAAAECRNGIGVCQIAQQEDGRGEHRHDRRAGEELEIGITEVQPGDEPEFFAHDTRDRHGKLQQPRKADDQHIFEHALTAGKQHEKHDQQQIVRQAQTALQRIVLHGLEHGDQQVDDHDQRQRQQADL